MFLKREDTQILKRILLLYKPYIKSIITVFICIFISSGFGMLLPMISKQIMDKGLLQKDIYITTKYALFSLLLLLLMEMLGLLETRQFAYMNSIIQFDLSKKAFKHTLQLKLRYFKNTNFAELMSNISMDINNISRVSDRSTFFIVEQALRIFGGLIGLLIIDWKLTLLILVIVPWKYFMVRYFAVKRRKIFEDLIKSSQEYSKWYGDTVLGVKEIKLWTCDRFKIGQFIKKQRSIVKTNIYLNILDRINQFSDSVLFQILTSTLYILGANMVFSNSLTIGSLIAFITYSTYVTAPISAILNIGYNFSSIFPSARRLFDFFDMECESKIGTIKEKRLSFGQAVGNIRFENVSFSYEPNRDKALKNISFEIGAGEKVAIVGANGSGKTTLINLLLRFYTPESGHIMLDEVDISFLDLKLYRTQISVVSQDLYLFNATIKDNISMFFRMDDLKIVKAAKQSGAHDFIQNIQKKYDTLIESNGTNLSGGERQKIALTRAFASNSRILVLDEATSNCDIDTELKINEILTKNNDGRTIIVITHRKNILKKVDKIVVLDSGTISSIGMHEELYGENSIYTNLFNAMQENEKEIS